MPEQSVRWRSVVVIAGGVLVLSSCGNSQDPAVRRVSDRFYAALSAQDGAAACAVLAPRTRDEVEQSAGKPCEEAILEEDLPQPGVTDRVSAFGAAAEVRYSGDTTFLSRFGDGWHVVAAGCSRFATGRYECRVEAG